MQGGESAFFPRRPVGFYWIRHTDDEYTTRPPHQRVITRLDRVIHMSLAIKFLGLTVVWIP